MAARPQRALPGHHPKPGHELVLQQLPVMALQGHRVLAVRYNHWLLRAPRAAAGMLLLLLLLLLLLSALPAMGAWHERLWPFGHGRGWHQWHLWHLWHLWHQWQLRLSAKATGNAAIIAAVSFTIILFTTTDAGALAAAAAAGVLPQEAQERNGCCLWPAALAKALQHQEEHTGV